MKLVLSYAYTSWAMTNGDEEKLLRFKSKILKEIHGPIYNKKEYKLEIRSNNQLIALYKKENVIQFVRITRQEWMGNFRRADGKLIKRIIIEKMEGTRPRGRP